MKIHTIPEYENLVVQVSDNEFQLLKKSIDEDGLHYPIAVNSDGIVLDGHHRRRACMELGKPLKYQVMSFANKTLEKKFVIISNLKRRQLTDYQRLLLAEALLPIEEELARQRQIALAGTRSNTLGQKFLKVDDDKKGRVRDIVAKEIGWSGKKLDAALTIKKHGTEDEKKALIEGRKKVGNIIKTYKQRRRREIILAESQKALPDPEDKNRMYTIFCGDFREKARQINDNSIDLIFTDPPYNSQSLPLYADLARIATRVLKPGGSLVTYIGQYAVPKVFDLILNNSDELRYWWMICVKHNGRQSQMYQKKITVQWKPLLWFTKGELRSDLKEFVVDYIESEQPNKSLDPWSQSPREASHMIASLTKMDENILDPFMGVGTTGIAALRLNRKFIGMDISKEKFDLTLRILEMVPMAEAKRKK